MLGIYVSVPVACFRKGLAREYLETEAIPPPSTCYGFLLSLVGEMDRQRHIGCRVTSVLLGNPPTSVVLRTVWRLKGSNSWRDPSQKWHLFTDGELKQFRKWIASKIGAEVNGYSEAEVVAKLKLLHWGKYLQEWIFLGQPLSQESLQLPKERAKSIRSWCTANSEFVPLLGSGENARPDYQQLLTEVKLVIWLDSQDEKSSDAPNLEDRVSEALTHPSSVSRFGGLSIGESTHLVDEVTLINRLVEREPQKLEQPARAFLVRERGRFTLPTWVDHVGSARTRYATGDLVECQPQSAPRAIDLPRIAPDY